MSCVSVIWRKKAIDIGDTGVNWLHVACVVIGCSYIDYYSKNSCLSWMATRGQMWEHITVRVMSTNTLTTGSPNVTHPITFWLICLWLSLPYLVCGCWESTVLSQIRVVVRGVLI